MTEYKTETGFFPAEGQGAVRRLGAAALLILALCALLTIPAFAAAQSMPLPYGQIKFDDVRAEGTVSCEGGTLTVYAMAPGTFLKKYGISPDTFITVYSCTVNGGSAELGGVRFQRDAAYFTENGLPFADETYWSYYFDPKDLGVYRCIEIREKDLDEAPVRFVMHCVASVPKPAANQCGDRVTWTLENGTLTIRGDGPMYDYYDEVLDPDHAALEPVSPPWIDREEEITAVVVEDGVTGIGDASLQFVPRSDAPQMEALTLPDSVERVGARAFFGNVYMKLNGDRLPASLRVIDRSAFGMCEMYFTFDELPSGVRFIGPSAFFDCGCLRGTLHIPQGVRSIPSGAFQWVPGLESVVIPDGVRSIGASAFSGCGGLKSVTIPVSVSSIGDYAFPGGLQDVWYGGTEAQWNALVPDAAKIGLSGSVTVHFTEGGSLTDGARAVLWAVDRSTGKVTVTGGLEAGETVYLVSYDARGRLIGLSAVTVPGGSAKLAADFDRAKLIWTGADGAPRSEHGELQQAAEG